MSFRNLIITCFLISFFNCTSKKTESNREQKPVISSIQEEDSVSLNQFEKLVQDYESEDRDEWQHPEIILKSLGDLKGKIVADIGAGTGYFSFKLAKTADTVYAVDIDKRFLDYINERKEGLLYGLGQNVITKLTTPQDPGSYPHLLDLVLFVNTYSYINNRVSYFKKVKKILKPGGVLYIVDFKEKNIPVGPPNGLRVSAELAQSELKKSGFKVFKADTVSLPYQYIIKAS